MLKGMTMTESYLAFGKTPWDTIGPNLLQLVVGLVAFAAIVYLCFLLASRASVKAQDWLKYLIFLVPASLLLLIGLIYPTIRTLIMAFMDSDSKQLSLIHI
jgi:alpha-glucoside transport system permease protein